MNNSGNAQNRNQLSSFPSFLFMRGNHFEQLRKFHVVHSHNQQKFRL